MTDVLHYPAPEGPENRLLLVMLPGVGIEAAAFFDHGMVGAVQAHGREQKLGIDVAAPRPELELYLDGEIGPALHRTVIEPARRQGYARIWLLGISLGGMGALHYAAGYAAEIEGLILLAPFLGTRGTVAEVERAGGLATWNPAQSIATDLERRTLLWLRDLLARQARAPALYLGYAQDDRFAPGHRLLADLLPEERVVTAEGGHDWDSWARLWRLVLERSPFSGQPP
jgi:pimeloyl-ACP methyl ester carboxylesterase